MSSDNVFVVVEIPYDHYIIRAICTTREKADAFVKQYDNATDYSFAIHEVTDLDTWKAGNPNDLPYMDQGWAEDVL